MPSPLLALPCTATWGPQAPTMPRTVLGEVFLRVARGLGRFRGSEADLRRWVFTIAHNCLMDEHGGGGDSTCCCAGWA